MSQTGGLQCRRCAECRQLITGQFNYGECKVLSSVLVSFHPLSLSLLQSLSAWLTENIQFFWFYRAGAVVSVGCYLQNTGHNNNKSNFPARILCFNQEKKMLAVIETIAECREQLYSSWSGDPSGGCRSRRTDWEYKWTININILIKYITWVPPPTHTNLTTIIVPGKGGNLSEPVLVWMVCLTFFPLCNERLIVAAGNSSLSERRCRPSIIRSNLTISSSQLTRAKYALTVLHLR